MENIGMGKKPTPQQVEWQKAARERLVLVLERLFGGNQTRLANALGVTQALVNIVVREVQPPTRNLMVRLGTIERVNPRWVETGEGEPLFPDVRGTLPVSDVLLPGPPLEYVAAMTVERFAVAGVYERPSCYYWRLPTEHPAASVDAWRLRSGDLLLLETSREVTDVPAKFAGRMCVLHGVCVGHEEPVYGSVTLDEKSRLVFGTPKPILRFNDLPRSYFEPSEAPAPRTRTASKKRRTWRDLDKHAMRATEQAADPWYALPRFDVTHILAVQLLMIRLS